MHRLSRVSRYTQSTTKFIQQGSRGTATDQADGHNFADYFLDTSLSHDCLNGRMLVGNVSSSSRLGRMVSRMFVRHSATFQLHPEKLKQIMRERDGQHLCNYYDSDNYKSKAVNVVEEQNRVINEGTPQNLKDTDVIYEHMLSCAQPRQKPKLIVVQKKKSEEEIPADVPGTMIKTRLRMSGKKKKKDVQAGTGLPVQEAQIIYSPDSSAKKEGVNIKDFRRKYRKRTTILPVYLKKIQDNMALKEKLIHETQRSSSKSAEKFDDTENINYDTQMLNTRKPIYVIKSDYKIPEQKIEKTDKDAKDQKKRERLINVDYETEVLNIDRFKVKSKFAEGGEQNRHWYQNPNAAKKIEGLDSESRYFSQKVE